MNTSTTRSIRLFSKQDGKVEYNNHSHGKILRFNGWWAVNVIGYVTFLLCLVLYNHRVMRFNIPIYVCTYSYYNVVAHGSTISVSTWVILTLRIELIRKLRVIFLSVCKEKIDYLQSSKGTTDYLKFRH